jgi:hypothetical protein
LYEKTPFREDTPKSQTFGGRFISGVFSENKAHALFEELYHLRVDELTVLVLALHIGVEGADDGELVPSSG